MSALAEAVQQPLFSNGEPAAPLQGEGVAAQTRNESHASTTQSDKAQSTLSWDSSHNQRDQLVPAERMVASHNREPSEVSGNITSGNHAPAEPARSNSEVSSENLYEGTHTDKTNA